MLATLEAKLITFVVAGCVVIAALVGVGWWQHNKGYAEAEALWAAKYDRLVADVEKTSALETQRQAEANLAAQRDAAAKLAALQASVADRETRIKELQDEASRDPDAGRECIGAGSVQRLNQIHTPGRH